MIVLAILGVLAFIAGVAALNAWIVMLIVGALHNSVWEVIPAFGFWQVWLVLLALGVLRQALFGGGFVQINRS